MYGPDRVIYFEIEHSVYKRFQCNATFVKAAEWDTLLAAVLKYYNRRQLSHYFADATWF